MLLSRNQAVGRAPRPRKRARLSLFSRGPLDLGSHGPEGLRAGREEVITQWQFRHAPSTSGPQYVSPGEQTLLELNMSRPHARVPCSRDGAQRNQGVQFHLKTDVQTPTMVFFQPQRLLVPLFQRPYVWSKEGQWVPLWEDVQRLADRAHAGIPVAPHFLGAVVLQQQTPKLGSMPEWTIIDGQQRLTTLQLLMDAAHEAVQEIGEGKLANQLQRLVLNPEDYVQESEDRNKVWPTNRDRAAFVEVMTTPGPVDYADLGNSTSRLARAHEFFYNSARDWLAQGDAQGRATALTVSLCDLLQLVVIQLQADEDAQEIFETLNARGTPLTAADLIKNFVFQRLEVSPGEAEKAYHAHWAEFETPFWETEVASGRIVYSRSSLFLNQWLVAQTREDVPAREVFARFKRYVIDDVNDVADLLPQIRRSADFYRDALEASQDTHRALSTLELFLYRTSTLESEVFKPLVLWLYDGDRPAIPEDQAVKALRCVESWMVRRACIRGNTKAYNRIAVDLIKMLEAGERSRAGDLVEEFLAGQDSANSHWPGDDEVRHSLETLPIYQRFRRPRLRMLLEAIEDHRRGWDEEKTLHEQRIVRSTCTIEHVIPQDWAKNWPGAEQEAEAARRRTLIQTLGNLTLVTQALNSKVSNGPWNGDYGKRAELSKHTSLLITQEVINLGDPEWTEDLISLRTDRMIDDVLEIWRIPEGHVGLPAAAVTRSKSHVTVADLVRAELLHPGQTLWARPQKYSHRSCQVTEDGTLFVGNRSFETPSGAAKGVTKAQSEAGWWFWLVEKGTDQSLSDLRQEYLDATDESDADEETDEE